MTSPILLSRRKTLGWSLLGGCLLWTAFPPLGWAWMAWIAPCCWLPLLTVAGFKPSPSRRRSRRIMGNGYFQMWLAHTVYWLMLLQGLRLAHWTTHFGWLALCFYLGIYLPAFVFAGRQLMRHLRLPVSVAAAVSWVSFEWLRGYVISGFSMGCLSHTQTDNLTLLQIADLGGSETISLLIILVAGSLYAVVKSIRKPQDQSRPVRYACLHGMIIALLVGTSLFYGKRRLEEVFVDFSSHTTVGLIQGSIDTQFGLTPEQYLKKTERQRQTYIRQSEFARHADAELKLLVWPESMFPFGPTYLTDPDNSDNIHVPQKPGYEDVSPREFQQHITTVQQKMALTNMQLLSLLNGASENQPTGQIQLIAGADTQDVSVKHTPIYNSAILFTPRGNIQEIYHKSHLVMFGEYIPLGDWFPWLYDVMPISPGLGAGNRILLFEIDDIVFAPSICFESTVPHLLRSMINQTNSQGRYPDVMLNMTNDGWFWGSAMLDLHFRCNIMRAVELRRPNLVAANTGISAWITATGKVIEREQKQEDGFVIAKVGKATQNSTYLRYGDLLSICCTLLVITACLARCNRQGRKPK